MTSSIANPPADAHLGGRLRLAGHDRPAGHISAAAVMTTGDNGPATIAADQPAGHRPTGQAGNHSRTLAQPAADRSVCLRRTDDSGTKPQDTEPARPRRRRASARNGL